MEGSLSTTIAPVLDSKYEQDILQSLKTLPMKSVGSGIDHCVFDYANNIIAYPDQDAVIFLYPNKIDKPVHLDVPSGKHSILTQSNKSPLLKRGQITDFFTIENVPYLC